MKTIDSAIEPPVPDESREVHAILRNFSSPDGSIAVYQLLDGQLGVLHGRAQSLMQLAGVVITVTGFSGRIIADTSRAAQVLIVSGVSLVALAAALALIFVSPIRWVSADLSLPVEDWVLVTIRRRNRKSRAIRGATLVLILGMAFYLVAIALMLLHPEVVELKRIR